MSLMCSAWLCEVFGGAFPLLLLFASALSSFDQVSSVITTFLEAQGQPRSLASTANSEETWLSSQVRKLHVGWVGFEECKC